MQNSVKSQSQLIRSLAYLQRTCVFVVRFYDFNVLMGVLSDEVK